MHDIVVRCFEAADEPGVTDLWRETLPDDRPWNTPEVIIQQKLAVQPELFFVAARGPEIVGTAIGGYDGRRGWVYCVAVDERHRRRGVGQALMNRVEQALADLGCPKLNLQVDSSNQEVVRFYESLGYRVEERVSMGKRLACVRSGPPD